MTPVQLTLQSSLLMVGLTHTDVQGTLKGKMIRKQRMRLEIFMNPTFMIKFTVLVLKGKRMRLTLNSWRLLLLILHLLLYWMILLNKLLKNCKKTLLVWCVDVSNFTYNILIICCTCGM